MSSVSPCLRHRGQAGCSASHVLCLPVSQSSWAGWLQCESCPLSPCVSVIVDRLAAVRVMSSVSPCLRHRGQAGCSASHVLCLSVSPSSWAGWLQCESCPLSPRVSVIVGRLAAVRVMSSVSPCLRHRGQAGCSASHVLCLPVSPSSWAGWLQCESCPLSPRVSVIVGRLAAVRVMSSVSPCLRHRGQAGCSASHVLCLPVSPSSWAGWLQCESCPLSPRVSVIVGRLAAVRVMSSVSPCLRHRGQAGCSASHVLRLPVSPSSWAGWLQCESCPLSPRVSVIVGRLAAVPVRCQWANKTEVSPSADNTCLQWANKTEVSPSADNTCLQWANKTEVSPSADNTCLQWANKTEVSHQQTTPAFSGLIKRRSAISRQHLPSVG
ncbi:hypothetical protein ACOMHN_039205 [Nucella lapillus]